MVKKTIVIALLSLIISWSSLELLSRQRAKSQMDEYNKVLRLKGQKKYDQAIERLKEIITVEPGFFYRAYAELADAYMAKKNIDAAIGFFENLIKQNKNNAYAFYGLGFAYKRKKQIQKAIEHYEQAIKIRPGFVEPYIGIVGCYKSMKSKKELEKCEYYLKEITKENPNNACAFCALGYFYFFQYRFKESLSALDQAIEIDPTIARAYFYKGQIFYFTDQYKKAVEAWSNELELARQKGDIIIEGAALANLATVYETFGEYEKSIDYQQKSLAVMKEVGNKKNQASLMENIAVTYSDLNNYEKAFEYLEQALQICKDINDEKCERSKYLNLGAIYQEVGDYITSMKYNNKVLSMIEDNDKSMMKNVLTNIGNNYYYLENHEKALEYYLKALDIKSKRNEDKKNARIYGNIGSMYISQDNKKAIEYFEKSLEIHKRIGNNIHAGHILISLGALYLNTGDPRYYKKAEEYYKEAGEIGSKLKVPELTWRSLAGMGHFYREKSNYEKSFEYCKRTIELIESVRGTLESGERKSGFLQTRIGAYEEICSILYELQSKENSLKYTAAAFDYMERAKARSFLDILAESRANIKQGIEPELLIREKELNREYALNQTELHTERSKEDNAIDKDKIKKLEEKLEGLEDEFKKLKNEMIKKNPQYTRLKYPEPINLTEFQGKLADESMVILEYMVTKNGVLQVKITKNNFEMQKIKIGRKSLQDMIHRLRAEMSPSIDRKSFARNSYNLYKLLLEPALKDIPEGKTLLIIPDDILHHLPFEALITSRTFGPTFKDLPFLIKKFPVHYVQSASVFAALKEKTKSRERPAKELLAMGDPYFGKKEIQNNSSLKSYLRAAGKGAVINRLAYSGAEVNAIGQLFDKKDIFLRENAKEELVKPPKRLDQYKYIHFSTHGFINKVKPELSGIILALDSDPAEDGLLLMREVFNLRVNAHLVVLSACDTGSGKSLRGEGIVGLTRAWMYAGTPSVMVSLMKVDDRATSQLMVRFYKNLKQGMNKAKALQEAKIRLMGETGKIMKQGRELEVSYGNPFYWAGFVLIGEK